MIITQERLNEYYSLLEDGEQLVTLQYMDEQRMFEIRRELGDFNWSITVADEGEHFMLEPEYVRNCLITLRTMRLGIYREINKQVPPILYAFGPQTNTLGQK